MLDPDLSKNLNFVKTYDGDVSELDLYFAVDEEVFGKMTTKPLLFDGDNTLVTNENRIEYCHRMAHYKLNVQLQKANAAFAKGIPMSTWMHRLYRCMRLVSRLYVCAHVSDYVFVRVCEIVGVCVSVFDWLVCVSVLHYVTMWFLSCV